jgi:mono/diheme cytochrome c family protein
VEIAVFLRHGADKSMGVAFGPMSEVVHDSLRYLTASDIHDIAVFLKEGPERQAPAPESDATRRQLRNGLQLYLSNCAQCHQDNGSGIAGAVPNLAGNAALNAERPNDIIDAILTGLQGTGNYGRMPSFAGAFTDQQIADIVNYVRSSWVNKSPTDATPALVASLRAASHVGAGGSEAARDFDCPEIGSAIVPQAMATPAQVALLANSGGADLENQIMVLVSATRSAQPGISDTNLVNMLNAAYCPVVANISGLSAAEKRTRLMSFALQIEDIIAANPAPANP